MITRLVLASLCGMCLTPAAMADKFYTGSEETAKKMTEGTPDFIEGVLLAEKDGFYVIRMEGGEINIAKSDVYKIDKDGLTVAQIEQREKAATVQLAQADKSRMAMQTAEAAARRASVSDVRAAEAAMRTQPVEEEVIPAVYDPIMHRVVPGTGSAIEGYTTKVYGGIIRRNMERKIRQLQLQMR